MPTCDRCRWLVLGLVKSVGRDTISRKIKPAAQDVRKRQLARKPVGICLLCDKPVAMSIRSPQRPTRFCTKHSEQNRAAVRAYRNK